MTDLMNYSWFDPVEVQDGILVIITDQIMTLIHDNLVVTTDQSRTAVCVNNLC